MSAETKDRITCHVLDTTTGQPARGLRVKLELVSSTPAAPVGGPFSPSNGTTTAAAGTVSPPPTATGTTTTSSLSSSSLPTPPTGPSPQPALAGARGGGGLRVFESLTDDDGRVKVWLPYSSATSSGEVPVYTLEDVLGSLSSASTASTATTATTTTTASSGTADAAAAAGVATSQWTLRFDSAGYFGGADKTFYPEVAVTFTVREGERYHVPLLLAPYGYSTYRGS